MKYTLSNIINRPLEVVAEKMKNPEGRKHWMEGLQRIEPVSGTPGEAGSRTDLHFLYRGKNMKMTETILEQNLPRQIRFGYQNPSGGYNEVEILFEKLSDNSVKQTSNSHFEMKGIMKVLAFFLKGFLKKQSMKFMTAFKNYAEQT